tara:strand:+ start:790 stop:1446 length:657 start_codon:yes stop_codon:yes gene_type:complete
MSTLSTSKILVCIYTCEKDRSSLEKLKSTNWYKDISSRNNFQAIDVFADESINEEYQLKNNTLTVKTQESYDNLCIKTYKMIQACNQLFEFDYLLKIDSNIIENRHNKTSMLFSFEYFLEKFYNSGVIGEYNGLTPIAGNTIESFRNWANSKSLFVMPEVILSELGGNCWPKSYWAGGCYCLGKNSILKILQRKDLFDKFKNLMGGCEDMAIATSILS